MKHAYRWEQLWLSCTANIYNINGNNKPWYEQQINSDRKLAKYADYCEQQVI